MEIGKGNLMKGVIEIFCCLFGGKGCRKYYGYLVNIIGENILVLLFPSLFSEFGGRGLGKYYLSSHNIF